MEVKRYPGNRSNSFKFFCNGYQYHRDSRNHNIIRCTKRSSKNRCCPGTIYLGENFEVTDYICHDGHPPDLRAMLKEEYKKAILDQCKTTFDDFAVIFNRVSREQRFRTVRRTYKIENLLTSMKRARRLNVPVTPQLLAEVPDVLNNYPPVLGKYRGCATTNDGASALIFINEEMIEPLNQCTQLYADGTFKILPNIPRDIRQLYTIHFRKLDTGFPAIYVLMSRQTQELYEAMWDKLFEIVPNLRGVNSLMLDYERAAINAARRKFPEARIAGCLFHYKQALIKYWCNRLGMPRDANVDILEMAFALPFLPHDLIENGVNVLTRMADEDEDQRLHRFVQYIRRTWLPLAAIISVYGLAVRTNNTCEIFHKNALRRFQAHPTFFYFLEVLMDIMDDTNANFERVNENIILRSNRSADQIQNDVVLLNLQAQVLTGRISVTEFMTSIMMQRRLQYDPPLPFEDRRVSLGQINRQNEIEEAQLFIRDIQLIFVRDPGIGNEFENGRAQNNNREARVRAALQFPFAEHNVPPLEGIVQDRRFRRRGGGRGRGRGRRGRNVNANRQEPRENVDSNASTSAQNSEDEVISPERRRGQNLNRRERGGRAQNRVRRQVQGRDRNNRQDESSTVSSDNGSSNEDEPRQPSPDRVRNHARNLRRLDDRGRGQGRGIKRFQNQERGEFQRQLFEDENAVSSNEDASPQQSPHRLRNDLFNIERQGRGRGRGRGTHRGLNRTFNVAQDRQSEEDITESSHNEDEPQQRSPDRVRNDALNLLRRNRGRGRGTGMRRGQNRAFDAAQRRQSQDENTESNDENVEESREVSPQRSSDDAVNFIDLSEDEEMESNHDNDGEPREMSPGINIDDALNHRRLEDGGNGNDHVRNINDDQNLGIGVDVAQNELLEDNNANNEMPQEIPLPEEEAHQVAVRRSNSNEANRHRRRRKKKRLESAPQNVARPLAGPMGRNRRKKLNKKIEKQTLINQNNDLRKAAIDLAKQVRFLENERAHQNSLQCVICKNASPNYMFDTCKHVCLCEHCVANYKLFLQYYNASSKKSKCPFCNIYGNIERVYITHI